MQFRLRPFEEIVERGPNQPAWSVRGTIEGSTFMFSVDGARYAVPVVEIGEDGRGPFAVVDESEQILDHGFRLVVEMEPPTFPGDVVECSIRLFKPHPDQERMQKANPGAIVVLPVQASLSIDFGPDGDVSGRGIMTVSDLPPDMRPPDTRH